MKISIIIPSLNSPIIDLVLAHINQQVENKHIGEILVIGKDESNLIKPTEIIRFIDTEQPVSASKARNIGIINAKHKLLFFLDSDCLPTPRWLVEHLKAHDVGHTVVGGGVLPVGDNYWSLSYNITLFHEFLSTIPSGTRNYLPTLNLSVHRDVIDKVGILNESLIRGQDIEWTTRMKKAGFQPFFWPHATIHHAHNRTTFYKVWQDCARSGFYMRQIRLQNSNIIQSPRWLKHRALILGLSPVIAAGVTGRIVTKNPKILQYFWQTIPAIYLTKIAWCWGASQRHD